MEQVSETMWHADVERKNENTTKPPQVILDLPVPNPNRKELTEEEVTHAKKDLLMKEYIKLKYPREQKFRVDPSIPGQHIGLISFIPSKNAVPDKEGCFGVLKFRGAFPNGNEAETWGEKLLREVDTTAEIDMVYIGREFPLMVDNTVYCSTTREIDLRKTVDEIVRADKKAKLEKEQKEIEEVTKRQQKLLDKTHEEEKNTIFNDLDFYTTLRVKKAQALGLKDEAMKRLEEAQAVVKSASEEIEKLDIEFPEYKDQFMEKYMQALESTGSKASDNPLIKYMKDTN